MPTKSSPCRWPRLRRAARGAAFGATLAFSLALPAAETSTPASPAVPARLPVGHAVAPVEEVIATVDRGYRYRAYIVRWHGTRVLVSDVLATTNHEAGDPLSFMILRHEVGGIRTLHFLIAGAPKAVFATPASKVATDFQVTSSTAPVEEVLSAEDDGYRFRAYLVTWNDLRVAIEDPLASSHIGVGEPVGFLALRTTSRAGPLLSFVVPAAGEGTPRPALGQAKPPATLESGIVEAVLAAEDRSYQYRAYVVRWRGGRVVLDDPEAPTRYEVGDGVRFGVQRAPNPNPGTAAGGALIPSWNAAAPEPNSPREPFQTTLSNESGTVEEVLTSEVDGYRSVAYLVRWHGVPVAVRDMLARTHYAVGERVDVPVDRSVSGEHRWLRFDLFNFSPSPTSPPKCSPTAAP